MELAIWISSESSHIPVPTCNLFTLFVVLEVTICLDQSHPSGKTRIYFDVRISPVEAGGEDGGGGLVITSSPFRITAYY
jgi:hypothetical protein